MQFNYSQMYRRSQHIFLVNRSIKQAQSCFLLKIFASSNTYFQWNDLREQRTLPELGFSDSKMRRILVALSVVAPEDGCGILV